MFDLTSGTNGSQQSLTVDDWGHVVQILQIEQHIVAFYGSAPGMKASDATDSLAVVAVQNLQNILFGRRRINRLRPKLNITAEVVSLHVDRSFNTGLVFCS